MNVLIEDHPQETDWVAGPPPTACVVDPYSDLHALVYDDGAGCEIYF